MYTAFYGLREKPFALSPDPRFLFLAQSHREALAHLLYGIEQGEGFIAITGEVGTGKTTLCRTLLQRLGAETEVAFLFNPKLSALELMQAVLKEFGQGAAGRSWREMVDELNAFLLERNREGRRVLLIIDEAQNLETDTLEQVRLLSNLETDTAKLLQIVLLGQPELDAKLERPELRQLKQRIGVRWRLAPLTAAETREYVRHRLRIAAGTDRELFADSALREVHRRSGGIPRLVNLLCDRALLLGYAARAATVTPSQVTAVARELIGDDDAPGRATHARRRRFAFGAAAVVLGFALGLLAIRFLRHEAVTASASDAATAAPRAAVPPVAAPAPAPTAASEPPALPSSEASAAAPVAASDAIATAAVAAPGDAPPPAGPVSAAPPAAPPPDLAARLDALTPGRTAAASVDAILAAFGLPPAGASSLSPGDALAALARAGLATMPMSGATLADVVALDRPALIALAAPDGAARSVALVGAGDGHLTLSGVGSTEPLEATSDEVASRWLGEVFVVWRDPAGLPALLREGESGPAVRWLQEALIQVGLLRGTPTGVFDAATREAVQGFQRSRGLDPDGSVGPRTKLRLYEALGQDAGAPHLRAREAA